MNIAPILARYLNIKLNNCEIYKVLKYKYFMTDSNVIDTDELVARFQEALSSQPEPTPLLNGLLVYAGFLGKTSSKEDFLAGLPVEAGDMPEALAVRAMKRLGLSSNIKNTSKIKTEHLPALALFEDGAWHVVISRHGLSYVCIDPNVEEGQCILGAEEFEAKFAGTVLIARASIEDIERRHVGEASKGHWFWGRFKDQKALMFDITLGSLVANCLAVVVSLFAMQVYDRVIPNNSEATLWVLFSGACLAVLMEAILRISRSYLMDVSGKKLEIDLSAQLFEKLQGMHLSTRPASPGSLLYSIREFNSVREFFTMATIGAVADIPFVIIFLLLIYGIAGPAVWVIATGMLLIIIPSFLARSKMTKLAEEMLGGSSAANKLLTEAVYGHETIKTTRGESFFQRKWEEIILLNATKTTEQRALAVKLNHWASGIQQLTYVSSVVACVYLLFLGDLTVGSIIAVSILCSRTLSPITQLSGMISRWQQVKLSLSMLDGIVNSTQDRPIERQFARREIFTGDIHLQELEFKYHEDQPPALDIKHLTIPSGTSVAVLGSNGSGKSSLLKLLSGLYSPTSGQVFVDNMDLKQIDPEDVRRNIGYLPQEVKLFYGTLRDNILMGKHNINELRLLEALSFSGLDRAIKNHPMGLDLEIADGGDGLSTGQKLSVGLTRLYLDDPRIVLLDEPTASLDQMLELKLIQNLKQWLKNRTALITTHRMPLLKIVDQVVVLSNGEISMKGDTETVIKQLKTNSPSNKDTASDKLRDTA